MTASAVRSDPATRSAVAPLLFGIAVLLMVVLDVALLVPQFDPYGFRPDFSVFWTAAHVAVAHPDRLYDFAAMTQAQAWIADPALGSRPFLYPPSALLLFVPLRWLPFATAFVLWTAVSLVALWSIVRRVADAPAMWLTLLAPPVVQALSTGQTTLIVGAMIARGLAELERRPLVAGLWLGVAAAIKPQTLLMAPIALVRLRQWRALAAAGGAVLLMGAAALPFGAELWVDWLRALPRYGAVMASVGQNLTAISPASSAFNAGFGTAATLLVRIAGVAGGAALTWWAFGRQGWAMRLTALLCGAFLASPYAMPYELAVLAPVMAAVLLRRDALRWLAVAPLTGLGGVAAVLAPVALLLLGARPGRSTAEPAPMSGI